MQNSGIVPDIIDVLPPLGVKVAYPSGVTVNNGNELTPTQVKDQPTVCWEADSTKFYSLLFTDPDAPSRAEPKVREVRHWFVANIPGSDVSKGDALIEFIGSGPPKDTGLHRYIFLVFEQSAGKLDVTNAPRATIKTRNNRLSQSTRELIKTYNLGNPVAGNFYQAQYDDYVPLLHARFTE